MHNDELFRKWTPLDGEVLSSILRCTRSPGIHQLETAEIPSQIQKMPGLVSYFVNAYSSAISVGSSDTLAGGELAVVRIDQGRWKAYNFVFASSGDGQIYFNGPYKNFPEHHFTSTSQVSLESLFGHIPNST